MGKTVVLDRVVADLSRGRTHPAIQRLSSLVVAYPTDLDLRRRLAAVHRRVGNRIQAGRWDYLTIGADSADTSAFERAFPSAAARLRAMRWPYRASAAATSYARRRLAKLVAATQAEAGAAEAMAGPGAADPVKAGPAKADLGVHAAAGPHQAPAAAGGTAGHPALVRAQAMARMLLAPQQVRPWRLGSVLPLAAIAATTAVLAVVGGITVVEWIVR